MRGPSRLIAQSDCSGRLILRRVEVWSRLRPLTPVATIGPHFELEDKLGLHK